MFEVKEHEDLLKLADLVFVKESRFLKNFGFSIDSIDTEMCVLRFNMSDDLSATIRTPNLHGGAIASVLDTVGSMPVFARVISKKKGKSLHDRLQKLEANELRLGTVDLRIDYLRPGAGKYFLAKGWILRAGTSIAVTRMELHNDAETLIAVGTGTYAFG